MAERPDGGVIAAIERVAQFCHIAAAFLEITAHHGFQPRFHGDREFESSSGSELVDRFEQRGLLDGLGQMVRAAGGEAAVSGLLKGVSGQQKEWASSPARGSRE